MVLPALSSRAPRRLVRIYGSVDVRREGCFSRFGRRTGCSKETDLKEQENTLGVGYGRFWILCHRNLPVIMQTLLPVLNFASTKSAMCRLLKLFCEGTALLKWETTRFSSHEQDEIPPTIRRSAMPILQTPESSEWSCPSKLGRSHLDFDHVHQEPVEDLELIH